MTNVNVVLDSGVQQAFTEIVNEYLGKGMTYHLASMSGHQGEIAKVDVTDGQDVYRINLDRESYFGKGDDDFYGDIMVLMVERFDGEATQEIRSSHTLWTGRGEEVSRKTWFQIGRGRRKAWVETLEEAKACERKHWDRLKSRKSDNDRWGTKESKISVDTEEKRTIIRDMCRTHRGYARVKRAHIDQLVKKQWTDGSIKYTVRFTEDCGKDALVIKSVKAGA